MPVAVAPDPQTFDETRARMREIEQRQAAAASLRARRTAVAPMVLDEEPEPEPAKPASETGPDTRTEWADAVLRGDVPNATAREIVRAVAHRFGFTYADLAGPGRRRDIVRARWAAIHAVRLAKPHLSLPALGRLLGRDHTTVLHGLRAMEAEGVPQPDGTRIPLAEASTLAAEARLSGEGGRGA